MKTQIVFRIEDEDKRGPYNTSRRIDALDAHGSSNDPVHPEMHREINGVIQWASNRRYCFTSLKQL